MYCREILFTPRCSPRAVEFPSFGQLFSTTYGCGATWRQITQFSDFGLCSLYKTPKTYLPVTSLQPRSYIAEWLRFFCLVVEGPKGCGTGDFLRLLIGELGTQTWPNFRIWQMAIPIHNVTTRGVISGPKTSENTQFWERVYFPTKYLSPKLPKTPFWGTFQCETCYIDPLRQSHINGASTLKLYRYIGIGKYLEVCQKFSAKGRLGVQGPLM